METIGYFLAPSSWASPMWEVWRRKIAYATGLSFRLDPPATFQAIVRDGVVATDQLSYLHLYLGHHLSP